MNLTAGHSQRSDHIHAFQLSLKSLAGSKTSWTTHCVVPHYCSGHWFVEIPFGNYRGDLKILIQVYTFLGWRSMSSTQLKLLSAMLAIIDIRRMVHCNIYACINIGKQSSLHLLSGCKSNHSTPYVITGCYVITLRIAFGQTNEVGYSPSLLYYELLITLTGWASNRARGGWTKALVPGISEADKKVITPGICCIMKQ